MKKSTKNGLRKLVTLLCACVFVFSLWKLVGISREYREGEELYQETASQYTTMADPAGEFNPAVSEEAATAPVQVDFTDLLQINEDIIGWIYMEDTVVNYPVLQGQNNWYYLDKTYYKNYLASGSIYLDSDNDRLFTDSHSIIYGHNMKNHTMFGDLSDLRDPAYLEEHPYVDLILIDGTWLRYEIFSLYRAHVEDGTYEVPLNEAGQYKPFLNLAVSKNMFAGGEPELPSVQKDDKVLTLSTCTEDSADMERFVVHAVLISVDGEPVNPEA